MDAVQYSLRVKDGDTFLQSPEGGTEVSMAHGVVCKAFDLALKKMKEGEKVALIIEPQCAPSIHSYQGTHAGCSACYMCQHPHGEHNAGFCL